MKSLLFILSVVLFPLLATAQQAPSLTQEQQTSFETLKKSGIISYYKGAEQIVSVDPDSWRAMNFQQRKLFTVNLCIYVNRHVLRDSTMDDWWVRVENMATGKKMAKWSKISGYKEF